MNVEKLIEKISECLDEGEVLLSDIAISKDNDIQNVTQDRTVEDPPSIFRVYDNRTGRQFFRVTFCTQSDKCITHNLEKELGHRP